MKIKITDLDLFEKYILCISKLVPGCKFEIKDNILISRAISESKTLRLSLESNCIESKDDFQFCLSDLIKLRKSIQLVNNYTDSNEIQLNITPQFITYNGESKFKLKLGKEELIEQYFDKPIKSTFNVDFSFDVQLSNIKKTIACSNIVDKNSDCRIYIYIDNNNVLAEIDDKTNNLADSIGIPISSEYTGKLDKYIPLSLENFKMLGMLNEENIHIDFIEKTALDVYSTMQSDNNKYIKLRLLSAIEKY